MIQSRTPGATSILMYHSIAANPRDPHAVRPDLFARQMAALAASSAVVVALREVVSRDTSWSVRRRVVLTFDDGYRDFLTMAMPVLARHALPATVFVPTGLLGGSAVWDSHDKSKRLMSWDDLADVRRMGFDIGSHTVTHARLTECGDAELDRELVDSLQELRDRIDDPLPVLSYPAGFFGAREKAAARRAGYIAAVGVNRRLPNFPWTDRFDLRRASWAK